MAAFNVHIHAYGDPEWCRRAIASVPSDVQVRVFDGRYVDFGDSDDPPLTPGLAGVCQEFDNARYYLPPYWERPFRGSSKWRTPVHLKSKWAFRQLPPDEWTLKLDTDETLEAFDTTLDHFPEDHKFAVPIDMGDETAHIARLFKPKHWTPWVDDCLLPRDLFPLNHPVTHLARAYQDDSYRAIRFIKRAHANGIRIRNRGDERPESYRRKRQAQLDAMGRDDRFTDLKARFEDTD